MEQTAMRTEVRNQKSEVRSQKSEIRNSVFCPSVFADSPSVAELLRRTGATLVWAKLFAVARPDKLSSVPSAALEACLCLFVLAWVFWTGLGCQTVTKKSLAGKTTLPPDIVGTWKAQDSPWKIVLSSDGTLSSAVIPMGEVEIKPNQTTKVEMKDSSFSTFKAGNCVVEYTPETRELFVSVEMEKIHIRFLENVIDGNSIDRFVGPVSEDGKFWMADWIAVFDYGPRFPQEPNDISAKPLVFEKME